MSVANVNLQGLKHGKLDRYEIVHAWTDLVKAVCGMTQTQCSVQCAQARPGLPKEVQQAPLHYEILWYFSMRFASTTDSTAKCHSALVRLLAMPVYSKPACHIASRTRLTRRRRPISSTLQCLFPPLLPSPPTMSFVDALKVLAEDNPKYYRILKSPPPPPPPNHEFCRCFESTSKRTTQSITES